MVRRGTGTETVHDYSKKGIILPTYQKYCNRLLEKADAVYVKAGRVNVIEPGDSIFCLGIQPFHGLLMSAVVASPIVCDDAHSVWSRFHDKIVMGKSDFFSYAGDRLISAIPIADIRSLDLPKEVLAFMNCKVNPRSRKFVFGKLLDELKAVAEGKTGIITPNGVNIGDAFYIVGGCKTIPLRLMAEIIYANEFEQPVAAGIKSATFRYGIRLPALFEKLPLKTPDGKMIGMTDVEKIMVGKLNTALRGPVGEELFRREGVFSSVEDLFEALRRFYPGIQEEDLVTCLAHSKPIT